MPREVDASLWRITVTCRPALPLATGGWNLVGLWLGVFLNVARKRHDALWQRATVSFVTIVINSSQRRSFSHQMT